MQRPWFSHGGNWRMAYRLGAVLAAGAAGGQAGAQPAPDYDFDFVTIGNPNNRGYDGPVGEVPYNGFPSGRGAIGYTFRVSRLEVTTSQWLEYVNTFTTQSDGMAFFLREPLHWGGESDLGYSGPGRRYVLDDDVPNAGTAPVAGITWREGARFCNWLHGGKSTAVGTLDTGAYDTSTWGPGPVGGSYTDQERHLPGARFWIPTVDEYLKASHYDPNKGGAGVDGWWHYNNRSDARPPLPGLPGVGDTSATTGNWRIALGSYPQTSSAYGLLDLSGGASEWLEDLDVWNGSTTSRLWDGAYVDMDPLRPLNRWPDAAWRVGAEDPRFGDSHLGLRIASVIPSPSVASALTVWLAGMGARRRKRA